VSVSVSFPIELETQNKGVSTKGTYLSHSDEEIEIWCLSNPGFWLANGVWSSHGVAHPSVEIIL